MSTAPVTANLTYVTDDLPGTGGVLKQRPEDFLVEERALYEPHGSGEHLYLFIEKQKQTTSDVIRRLAKLFSARRSDVGYAGLKDKYAITRQHFSVPAPGADVEAKLLARFEFLPFKLLWAKRHANKLRRGHLSGNQFVIYIRQVDPTAVVAARRTLERLVEIGVPNYVGHQRFGYRQNNHVLGRLLIQQRWHAFLDQMLGHSELGYGSKTTFGRMAFEAGEYRESLDHWPRHFRHDRQALDALRQGRSAEEAVMSIESLQREFLISAVQSQMFNYVLDWRIQHSSTMRFDRLVEGDLAWQHDNRSVFLVDKAAAVHDNGLDGRVRTKEVSPSGPMWGPDMPKTCGEPAELESRALLEAGLSESDLASVRKPYMRGTRRPLRVAIRDPQVCSGTDQHGPYVRVVFEMPRGAYATVVLREIMKNEDCDIAKSMSEAKNP